MDIRPSMHGFRDNRQYKEHGVDIRLPSVSNAASNSSAGLAGVACLLSSAPAHNHICGGVYIIGLMHAMVNEIKLTEAPTISSAPPGMQPLRFSSTVDIGGAGVSGVYDDKR
ncbi:MAG: hypothetical protein ACYDBB_00855 [Armatimonadota bacterium]